MEIRLLKYFLAVAQEENMSRAAEFLHTTQPNLSRQIQVLEDELGHRLIIRGARKITLTDEGLLLRKRAQEIVELCEKTESEIKYTNNEIAGNIYIGGGESYVVKIIAKTAHNIQKFYPKIKFHFFSGDTIDVVEKLEKGLIDFGILIEPNDIKKFDYLELPLKDTWGFFINNNDPLSKNEFISPEDIKNKPLIISKHSLSESRITDWFNSNPKDLNIVATYNLIYNASLLVEQEVGYALCLDKLINTNGSNMTFVPLNPKLETSVYFGWKKYQIMPKHLQLFIEYLNNEINSYL